MMRWTKSVFTVLLGVMMVFVLAACGGADGTETPGSAGTQGQQAASEAGQQEQAVSDVGQRAASESGQQEQAASDAGQRAASESGQQEQAASDVGQRAASAADHAESLPEEVAAAGSDILVVYFSRTGEQYGVGVIDKGNTEIVAEMIAEETGADSFEILPEEDYYPYTYDELTDIAKQEQNENARPAYAGEVPDLSLYSVIYVGAPVWWGDWPMIMYTFFEENAEALAGKTLIPFSTHGGSGLAGFDKKLAAVCPDSEVGTGLAVAGSDAQNSRDKVRSAVRDWIAGQ